MFVCCIVFVVIRATHTPSRKLAITELRDQLSDQSLQTYLISSAVSIWGFNNAGYSRHFKELSDS